MILAKYQFEKLNRELRKMPRSEFNSSAHALYNRLQETREILKTRKRVDGKITVRMTRNQRKLAWDILTGRK